MERTWRWFGKKDKITLAMLKQLLLCMMFLWVRYGPARRSVT